MTGQINDFTRAQSKGFSIDKLQSGWSADEKRVKVGERRQSTEIIQNAD